ncbi:MULTISPECIES: hypothetical protein [Pseudanabaena]|jgi:hypothetical protein|uniref:hypothetical protein n=1 Tax=Pseudanabaena TaxID=1152 RepID=UPI00247A9252|nr:MULTISPECIES: hypothetical protein [Pseudanabaena]MEA5487054.1 hypothetical protein [Pseudanabaena sp. CCNP1317]WGS73241.1 hypothetical protein OA858_04215 [Pseudanabaena galeata CCNP1313]
MSDRLKFFRRLMSAFEGTSNPQRAVERGFYVNLPNNPVAVITAKIALRPSSAHLLFGGIGSGKTTQLLLTQQALNELEDIKAIYVDVSLVTDISDLKSGALIVIAGLELLKILGDIEESKLKSCKKIIENAAYGYNEIKILPSLSESLNASSAIFRAISSSREIVTNHKGLLSTEKQENKDLVLRAFSALYKATQEKIGRKIIFLFDGLDRLSDSQVFIDATLNDIVEIKNAGGGSVLVGSVVTIYKKRENITSFDSSSYYLSYLDVFESVEVQDFFADVIKVRDVENLINPDVRQFLTFKSGGVLRDLMSLCQASIEEAYMDGSDKITEKHANQAALSLARSKIIGLTESNVNILRQVLTGENFFPRTSEDFELLLTGHILEYRHPRQRFVVHPILAPIIENMVASVANG